MLICSYSTSWHKTYWGWLAKKVRILGSRMTSTQDPGYNPHKQNPVSGNATSIWSHRISTKAYTKLQLFKHITFEKIESDGETTASRPCFWTSTHSTCPSSNHVSQANQFPHLQTINAKSKNSYSKRVKHVGNKLWSNWFELGAAR